MGLKEIAETIDKFLWGWPQIILLLGTHLFMSFKTGFIQKDTFKAIKLSFTKDPDAAPVKKSRHFFVTRRQFF